MTLSCSCEFDDLEWFYNSPTDYQTLDTVRRRRCYSCKNQIELGAITTKFESYRMPRTDIEERIYGDDGEVPMASKYMCEECSDLFFSLTELGYCFTLGVYSMKQLVAMHNDKSRIMRVKQ